MDCGLWLVACGLWTVACGPWPVAVGPPGCNPWQWNLPHIQNPPPPSSPPREQAEAKVGLTWRFAQFYMYPTIESPEQALSVSLYAPCDPYLTLYLISI